MKFQPIVPRSGLDAIYRLQSWVTPTRRNPAQCLEFLSVRRIRYQVLHSYQTLFPSAFAASQSNPYPEQDDLPSDREVEFMRRIDQTLFPLSWMDWDDCYEHLLSGPLVEPHGIDWWETSLDEFRGGWQLLMAFSESIHDIWSGYEETLITYLQAAFNLSLGHMTPFERIDMIALQQLFKPQPIPIRYLPLALQVIEHDTGNVWLDACSSDYEYSAWDDQRYDWSPQTLRILAIDFRYAKLLLARCDQLADWLEVDTKRIYFLIDLWNQAAKP
ncbi:MAG: hypothetical protein QNJ46_24945 [Leptolyngbyaceae cyanobacterium MO_188.B28]|nr:hypothetical protein [Leptolyngbyaceae cyanobacterium MO_188.B28]